MKVRMKVGVSGLRHDGRDWPPVGQVLDVPDWEGADLCASGIAEQAGKPERVETAVAPPAETAQTPKPEASAVPEPERRRGRPRKPRDSKGNIVKE